MAILAVYVLLGCAQPAQLRYEDTLDATPAPETHKVHGERLVGLMRGLDQLRFARLPQAMDVDLERETRGRQIAVVAQALAASARSIPGAADVSNLRGPDRRAFLALATQLEERAQRLAQAAQQRPPVNLDDPLAAVEATCDACHTDFRLGGLRGSE